MVSSPRGGMMVSELCCRRLLLIAEVKVTHSDCSQHCTNADTEVLLCFPCLSPAHHEIFIFCKLIQPCLPDKRGCKLNCLFVFWGGGRKQQGKHCTLTQSQERKAKPLQQQVAPKQMLNKAVHQYALPVLPGPAFSQSWLDRLVVASFFLKRHH